MIPLSILFSALLTMQGSAAFPPLQDCLEASDQEIGQWLDDPSASPEWQRILIANDPADAYMETAAIVTRPVPPSTSPVTVPVYRTTFLDGTVKLRAFNQENLTGYESFVFALPTCVPTRSLPKPKPSPQPAPTPAPAPTERPVGDAELDRLEAAGKLVVMNISPRFPLSVLALENVYSASLRNGAGFVLVSEDGNPGSYDPVARRTLEGFLRRTGVKIRAFDSARLAGHGLPLHAPSLFLADGLRKNFLLSGFKRKAFYDASLDRFFSRGGSLGRPSPSAMPHIAAVREKLAKMRRFTVSARSVEATWPLAGLDSFGSYFRPQLESGFFQFTTPDPSARRLHFFEIGGAHARYSMPFLNTDFVDAQGQPLITWDLTRVPGLPLSLLWGYNSDMSFGQAIFDASQEAIAARQFKPLYSSTQVGNLYPSIGYLGDQGGARIYRILTNSGGNNSEIVSISKRNGTYEIQPLQRKSDLCDNLDYSTSTPSIANDGNYFTATNDGWGYLFQIKTDLSCKAVYDTGMKVSKMDTSEGLDQIAFVSTLHRFNDIDQAYLGNRHRSFVLDRESEWLVLLNQSLQDDAYYEAYPAFLGGNRLSVHKYLRSGRPALEIYEVEKTRRQSLQGRREAGLKRSRSVLL